MPTPRSLTGAQHADFELHLVSGEWPEGISGQVLFSSPENSGLVDYGIFDFGMMCGLSLTPATHGAAPGRFSWRARSIRTPSRRLFDTDPGLFVGTGPLGFNSPFGSPNCANTAPLPWGDRLFATWDGGRPVEIHPDTFEFVAEVGHIDSWGGPSMPGDSLLPFVLSTAHPVIDPERDCLWSAKLDMTFEPSLGFRPSIIRYDGQGAEVGRWPLDGVSFNGSVHTVSQTRDWVILSDSGNYRVDPGEMMGAEREVTVDDAAPVWLVRKEVLEATPSGTPVTPVTFQMAPPSGHYYAQYDDSDGISVIWEGMDVMDLAMYMRPGDLDANGNPIDPAVIGLYNMSMAPETLVEFRFDPETGRVKDRGRFRETRGFNLQLSAMDWTLEGLSQPTLHHVDFQGCRPGRISARAALLYDDRIDRDLLREDTPGFLASFRRGSVEMQSSWDYPDVDDLIASPTYVPRVDPSTGSRYGAVEPGGHDGWVVQPVFNDDGFRVELFDAGSVGAGPVATLAGTDRQCVPLLLHSAWMPSVGELAQADRLSWRDELSSERVALVPDDHRTKVEQVLADLDGVTE